MLIRDLIANRLSNAVEMAQRLDILPVAALPDVVVERPQNPEHGDFASSLPVRLARAAGMSPTATSRRGPAAGCRSSS